MRVPPSTRHHCHFYYCYVASQAHKANVGKKRCAKYWAITEGIIYNMNRISKVTGAIYYIYTYDGSAAFLMDRLPVFIVVRVI